MRKILSLLAAAMLLVVGGATAATPMGQETCPGTTFDESEGGWVKYDDLSGTSFDLPEKDGFTITEVCYKAATAVVYPGPGDPVSSTVTNRNGKVQDLSHVAAYYTPSKSASVEVEVVGPVFTAPTCQAPGSLAYQDTEHYTFGVSGPQSARVLTAVPASADVVLVGPVEFGPYDLTGLTGEQCYGPAPAPTPGPVPVDVDVEVVGPVFTAPTCQAPGSLAYQDTEHYTFGVSGPQSARVLTAVPASADVVLVGPVEFGA